MEKFVEVGRVADFRDRRGKAVRVGEDTVAVFRVGDRFFAIQDACPHMGASLAEGTVLGERVRCRWHEWHFHLPTGECDMRSWACARVYEVRVDRDSVWVRQGPDAPAEREPDEERERLIEWDDERFFRKPGEGDP